MLSYTSNLKELKLELCKEIKNPIMDSVSQLLFLDLAYTQISDTCLERIIAPLQKLQELSVRMCKALDIPAIINPKLQRVHLR